MRVRQNAYHCSGKALSGVTKWARPEASRGSGESVMEEIQLYLGYVVSLADPLQSPAHWCTAWPLGLAQCPSCERFRHRHQAVVVWSSQGEPTQRVPCQGICCPQDTWSLSTSSCTRKGRSKGRAKLRWSRMAFPFSIGTLLGLCLSSVPSPKLDNVALESLGAVLHSHTGNSFCNPLAFLPPWGNTSFTPSREDGRWLKKSHSLQEQRYCPRSLIFFHPFLPRAIHSVELFCP